MKFFNSVLVILLLFNFATTEMMGQKIKFKKEKVLVDEQLLLEKTATEELGSQTNVEYTDSKNQIVKISFESPDFFGFKVLLPAPLTEITFDLKNIDEKKLPNACQEVLRFLMDEKIILPSGGYNTTKEHLEKITDTHMGTFWQQLANENYSVNGFQYEVKSIYKGGRNPKEVYRIARLDNTKKEVGEPIELDKAYTGNGTLQSTIDQELKSFLIHKTFTPDDGNMLYGLDKVFVNADGTLSEDLKNGRLEAEKPVIKEERTKVNATFKTGPRDISKWVQRNFEFDDFEHLLDEGSNRLNLRAIFQIDQTGAVNTVEVYGTDSPEIIKLVQQKLERMPKWNPATENGIPVSNQFSLPIHLRR